MKKGQWLNGRTDLVHFAFIWQRMGTRRTSINTGLHAFQSFNMLLINDDIVSLSLRSDTRSWRHVECSSTSGSLEEKSGSSINERNRELEKNTVVFKLQTKKTGEGRQWKTLIAVWLILWKMEVLFCNPPGPAPSCSCWLAALADWLASLLAARAVSSSQRPFSDGKAKRSPKKGPTQMPR